MPPPPARLPLTDPSDFLEEMSRAGFESIRVEERSHGIEFPSPEAVIAWARRTNIQFVLLREQLGDARFDAVCSELVVRLAKRVGDGHQKIPLTGLLGMGTCSAA